MRRGARPREDDGTKLGVTITVKKVEGGRASYEAVVDRK
jgi:hypothetical protein